MIFALERCERMPLRVLSFVKEDYLDDMIPLQKYYENVFAYSHVFVHSEHIVVFPTKTYIFLANPYCMFVCKFSLDGFPKRNYPRKISKKGFKQVFGCKRPEMF